MIDEPTNHLDGPGRALVANYLKEALIKAGKSQANKRR